MLIIDKKNKPSIKPSMYLHGLTGAGKSTWACTGGSPLVILSEAKAASVLHLVNPEACAMMPESLEDLVKVFEFLGKPERMAKFDRVVLDSVTEITNSIPRWMRDQSGNRNILTKLEISEYGDLGEYSMALVKAIQLTGLPSVIIARSISKKVGLIERIMPDGTGSTVNRLPGKLLPTAECRFDDELGFVVDTTAAEHSQRCGLPWLPPIWQGSCQDFLAIVEGKEAPAPATKAVEEVPALLDKIEKATEPAAPAGPSQAFVDAIEGLNQAAYRAGLSSEERVDLVRRWLNKGEAEWDESTAHKEITKLVKPPTVADVAKEAKATKAAKEKPATPEVEAFVDQVAAGPGITAEEWRELLDLCLANNVDQEALFLYCQDRGHLLKGPADKKLGNLANKPWASIVEIIRNPNKRRQITSAIQPFSKKPAV